MMKGRKKKLVVWLLALSVLMSQVTSMDAAATVGTEPADPAVTVVDEPGDTDAAEPSGDGAVVVPDGTDTPNPGDGTDAGTVPGQDGDGDQNTDSGNSDIITVPDTNADTNAPAEPKADEPDEGKEEEENKEEEKKEDEEEAVSGLINKLAVLEHEIQAPGEQGVVVYYGDGTEDISSVKLVVAGEDGKQIDIPLTERIEDKFSFVKQYEQSEAGTYSLVAFRYEEEGRRKRVDLKSIGIDVQYTVYGDAAEVEEQCTEEPGISVTAVTSDEISDEMTSDIQETIQEAADEAVENVLEGATALESSSTDQSYAQAAVDAAMTASRKDGVMLGAYSTPQSYTGASTAIIVLDPGHGGAEVGSKIKLKSGKELYEKDFNLAIAKYCKAELEKYNGVKVYMTRMEDKKVELEDRVEAAKLMGATLFVSIHMNASEDSKVSGAEVYYPNASYNPIVSNEGKAAAQDILDELVDLGLANRGIKIRNASDGDTYEDGSLADYYSVIRNSKKNGFPGIIVEHAFLTSKTDSEELVKNGQMNSAFLKELGQADAKGILKYCQTRTDYSSVYDFSYYMNRYPDLKRLYGGNKNAALQHFINYGMSEGRQGSKEFNVDAYRDRYPDLKAAFGTNNASYYMHYINFGRKEGRIATTDGSVTNNNNNNNDANGSAKADTPENTVYGGTDYGAVYDYEYYINRYSDLAAVFNGNYAGALRHFVMNGMNEGRQAIGTFNVSSYKKINDNGYTDKNGKTFSALSKLGYGDNLRLYYLHYIEVGKAEGRPGIYDDEVEGNRNPDKVDGPTKYGLVDYAPVYDYDYYITHNDDVRRSYGQSQDKVLQHFVRHGMDEGRQGNADFNVFGYKSRYGDLRAAFGDNLKEYYLHYINHGKAEGRRSALEITTVYQGVNYGTTATDGDNSVYNFDYYIGKYDDLYAAFANDPAGALQHFVTHGIAEGRQACEGFNISAYKSNNSDLRNMFGDNDMAYVRHYMTYGYKEDGRNASSVVLHSILKSNTSMETSKKQMVMYFLANASYPDYYAKNTDIRTIEEFCEVYIQECAAFSKKIDPAVAFCQAMKETNFLKFTGDVKINQYNFAGLGATGNSAKGASFRSIREGIRAHVQHLYAYAEPTANENNLGNACVDPRFNYVTKGSAMYVEWLGQKENPIPGKGWATAEGYGNSIVNDYMNKLQMYPK